MSQSKSKQSSRILKLAVSLVGLGIIAVVAVAFLMTRDVSSPMRGTGGEETVFADLTEQVDAISRIEIVGRDAATTLNANNGDTWVVEEKDGYPALSGRVSGLLSDLNELRALDRDQPSQTEMSDRGVADVEEGGKGLRVSFRDSEGDLLKEFVVGRSRSAPGATDLTAFYLRESGSDEVFLIDGTLDVPADPMEWIDEVAFAIDNQRIHEAETAPDEGEPVTVRRDTPGEAPYVVGGLPDDQELEGPWVLTELLVPFTGLVFSDVMALSEFDGKPREESGYVRTFDGVRVSFTFYPREADGDDEEEEQPSDLVRFTVDTVEPMVREAVEDNDDLPSESEVLSEDAQSAEDIAGRVEGWLYEVPDHTMDRLRQNLRGLPTRGVAGASDVPEAGEDL